MRRLCLSLVTLLAIICLFQHSSDVSAGSYDVRAAIPYPAPTQPATVDPQLNGLVSSNQEVEVFGTCQNTSPLSVVSIWRGSTMIGSVNCEANGTFRIKVSLSDGINNLIIRTSSLSNLYGPDSSAFAITYTPKQSGRSASSTPGSPAITDDLNIQTSNTFEVIDDNNVVTVLVVVSGGISPYVITLNWGDGSIDSKAVDGPGKYVFTHKYEQQGFYKALATVTDVLGATSTYQFLISAMSATTGPESKNDNIGSNSSDNSREGSDVLNLIIAAVIVVGFLIVSTFFLFSFWLGQRFEYGKLKNTKKRFIKINNTKKVRK